MNPARRLNLPLLCLLAALAVNAVIVPPFAAYMQAKPIEEKLGFVPSVSAIRLMSADHKELLGAGLVMKVMMYFGGLMDLQEKAVAVPPDYAGMSRLLHGALKLDPYNVDGYYFAQAFLVWDVQQIKVANDLLDYGMSYRTWDWYLPFFAGFNHAYFLKDYRKAAEYYRRAADLSGDQLFAALAGRYFQESGQTELAIGYLKGMLATARTEMAKKSFATRLQAFQEVRRIELARDRYRETVGQLPASLDELLSRGYLAPPPVDPYGGQFYLDATGKVYSTSQFAFGDKREKRTDEQP